MDDDELAGARGGPECYAGRVRGAWLLVVSLGCGSSEPGTDPEATPSGAYTLHQTPQSCSPTLPALQQLVIDGDTYQLGSTTPGHAFVAPAAPLDEPANVLFSRSWTENIIVDSTPTTVSYALRYELWGDSHQLVGTATYTAANRTCMHTVESDVR